MQKKKTYSKRVHNRQVKIYMPYMNEIANFSAFKNPGLLFGFLLATYKALSGRVVAVL